MVTGESLVLIKATEVGLEVMELSRMIIVLFGIGITFVRSIKLSLLYKKFLLYPPLTLAQISKPMATKSPKNSS